MHSSQGAFPSVKRNATLHQSGIESVGVELLLTPRTRKKSPLILHPFGPDVENAREFCFRENHTWADSGWPQFASFLVRLLPDVFVKHASGKGL